MKTWSEKYFGSDHWGINTRSRVRTAGVYFGGTLACMVIYWCKKPEGITYLSGILWCYLCGFLGLGFRAWQWRLEKEPNDPRRDDKDVPPPFPAYIIDYPIIVMVNSIALYLILYYLQVQSSNFYLIVFPIAFYFGSIVKLVKPKWW